MVSLCLPDHFVCNTAAAASLNVASSIMSANSPFPMPPATADLATTWTFLEEGLDHIMTKLQTGVSYSKVLTCLFKSFDLLKSISSICLYTPWRTTTVLRPRCMDQRTSVWAIGVRQTFSISYPCIFITSMCSWC